jgi:formylglycine-generating enzyme required for sulfatase activity
MCLNPAPWTHSRPNPFGLTDMSADVWQWIVGMRLMARAPTHGEPWLTGDCNRRMVRGGAFNNKPEYARTAFRFREVGDLRTALVGFRAVRDM